MYNNSGAKVKGLASVIAGIFMVISVIAGIVTMIGGSFLGGVITAAIGCLVAWLSGLTLAAFGELVENSNKIVKLLSGEAPKGRQAPAGYQPSAQQPHTARQAPQPRPAQICRACGAPRKSSSPFCGSCGAKMD